MNLEGIREDYQKEISTKDAQKEETQLTILDSMLLVLIFKIMLNNSHNLISLILKWLSPSKTSIKSSIETKLSNNLGLVSKLTTIFSLSKHLEPSICLGSE